MKAAAAAAALVRDAGRNLQDTLHCTSAAGERRRAGEVLGFRA